VQNSSLGQHRQKIFGIVLLSLALPLSSALASAETFAGSVKNGTTGKPGAGDDVVLIKLAQGMEEAGRTKADAQGKFSFNLDDAGGPHLIRVIHQGVTYHKMAPPGTTSVEVPVYDAAKKLEGISAVADLMYVQSQQGQLGINRLFAVDNHSKPPRTQMNEQNFEFYLPVDAEIDQAQAQTAGGQWVDSAPVPQTEKGRYAFVFPLRPGTTQFQLSYHLNYGGNIKLDPKPVYPLEHLVVILPKSMQFSPGQSGLYEEKQPPDQPKGIAEVAANVRPGQALDFGISGTGMLEESTAKEAEGGGSNAPAAGRDSRPGGGLGPPIDAPDPLEKYRWPILVGFALALGAGAIYIARRPRTAAGPEFSGARATEVEIPVVQKPPAARFGLLDALKEELFELEMEHKRGSISQQEYEKAKAALDQTLERALKRKPAKVI
jgi:hypothetical protein